MRTNQNSTCIVQNGGYGGGGAGGSYQESGEVDGCSGGEHHTSFGHISSWCGTIMSTTMCILHAQMLGVVLKYTPQVFAQDLTSSSGNEGGGGYSGLRINNINHSGDAGFMDGADPTGVGGLSNIAGPAMFTGFTRGLEDVPADDGSVSVVQLS